MPADDPKEPPAEPEDTPPAPDDETPFDEPDREKIQEGPGDENR